MQVQRGGIAITEEQIGLLAKATKNLKDEDMKHKSWMTEEILLLMEERVKQKSNPTTYKNTQKDIQRRIRTVKKNCMRNAVKLSFAKQI